MPLFQNESLCENLARKYEFHLREYEPVGGSQFRMDGYARRLVLT